MLMTARQCAQGCFRMLTIDKRLSPLPCVERVLPGVIAIIAPSTAFPEKRTQLLGMRFDYMGTSNCSFCNLTSSEAIFSCSDPPLCFSQHYLSPKFCLPYFAAQASLKTNTSSLQAKAGASSTQLCNGPGHLVCKPLGRRWRRGKKGVT